MPKASVMEKVTLSPAEMVLDMLMSILDAPGADVRKKLGMLRELCVERISFDSPQQAVKIISTLADIIASDPDAEVRVAALEAMERMIGLEEKAEIEQGKPAIDWRTVTVLLREAKKQTELDTVAVASRLGPPPPETPSPQLSKKISAISEQDAPPEAPAVSRDDAIPSAEAALLAVQETAVAALKQVDVPVVPPSKEMLASGPEPTVGEQKVQIKSETLQASVSAIPVPVAERPQSFGAPAPPVEEKPEPPIMKFLRSVADTDNEEHIRTLANRIIAKIENLTAPKPSPSSAPVLKED